jgi:undecaprenyl-diphosphatase
MDDWSSMPSDHAMVVAAMVAIIWAVSRRHALLAAAWGLVFVCFSRVHVGLHYASDVLIGFVLGLVLTFAVLRMPLPSISWQWLRRLDERRPALVFLGLFMFGWGLGDMFASARWFLAVLRDGLRADKTVALLLIMAAGALLLAFLTAGFLMRRSQAVRLRSVRVK